MVSEFIVLRSQKRLLQLHGAGEMAEFPPTVGILNTKPRLCGSKADV